MEFPLLILMKIHGDTILFMNSIKAIKDISLDYYQNILLKLHMLNKDKE